MKKSPAAALGKALSEQGKKHIGQINVALPCRVLTFDPGLLTADVQPLVRLTSSAPAPILGVPVTGMRVLIAGVETVLRPALHVGDIVLAVFADAEIKNTLSGQVAAPDTARRHSRNDAVIVGVMPCCL